MLKSRFGKLGASLIYCSEGEREHVGVRERKRDREEGERDTARKKTVSGFREFTVGEGVVRGERREGDSSLAEECDQEALGRW